MNAEQAFKLTQKVWADNEQDNMKYVIGYQKKVEESILLGKTIAAINIIPNDKADFVCSFYESMGYLVFFQPVSPEESAVKITWRTVPFSGRSFQEMEQFKKEIS